MDRSLQTLKQQRDDFTHSQSSAGTTTIKEILQGWWGVGEGVSSQWKISFPSKGRGWSDTAALLFMALLLTTLESPRGAPHTPWTTSLHLHRMKSISLTSNLGLTEEGWAQGQEDTTHSLAAASPAWNKLFPACTTHCCAPDTPCCAFYSHLLLEEKQDSRFSLTIITEEAAQSSPGLLALLVFAVFSTAFWPCAWLTGSPQPLSPCTKSQEEGMFGTAKCEVPTLWVQQLFKYCSCRSVVSYSCWEKKNNLQNTLSLAHNDMAGAATSLTTACEILWGLLCKETRKWRCPRLLLAAIPLPSVGKASQVQHPRANSISFTIFFQFFHWEGSSPFTSRRRGTEGTGSTRPWCRGHVLEFPVCCTPWRRLSSSLPCTGCGKAPPTAPGPARCHRGCTRVPGARLSPQSPGPCSPLLCSPGEGAEAGAAGAGWWSPLGAVWSRARAPWRDPRRGTLPGNRSRSRHRGWEAAGCPQLRGTWAQGQREERVRPSRVENPHRSPGERQGKLFPSPTASYCYCGF